MNDNYKTTIKVKHYSEGLNIKNRHSERKELKPGQQVTLSNINFQKSLMPLKKILNT